MDKLTVAYITSDGTYETEEIEWEEGSEEGEGEVVDWAEAVEDAEVDSTHKHGFAAESSDMEVERIKIVSFGGWPETMVRMRLKCWRVMGKRMCTKVPQLHRRTSTIEVYVLVKYPTSLEAAAKKAVKECAITAAAAAVSAAVATGGTGAGPAFAAAFNACLKAQIGPDTSLVKFEVPPPIRSNSTSWRPV